MLPSLFNQISFMILNFERNSVSTLKPGVSATKKLALLLKFCVLHGRAL